MIKLEERKRLNRLEYKRLKAERLRKQKQDRQRLKKALKKAMTKLAQKTIGLELTAPENNSAPEGIISYMDVQSSE